MALAGADLTQDRKPDVSLLTPDEGQRIMEVDAPQAFSHHAPMGGLPLGVNPGDTVALVALGPSHIAYTEMVMGHRGKRPLYDHVWTINRGVRHFKHDAVICMDDLRWIEKQDSGYANNLATHDKPIIVSTAYPEYPQAREYPFEEVRHLIGDDIFCINGVAYAAALAIYLKVKTFSLFGCDFFFQGRDRAEEGGQAVAYLLGLGRAFGMDYKVPNNSSLLYCNTARVVGGTLQRVRYGYHRKDEMKAKEKKEKRDG